MATFASILDTSSRKSILVTACDTYPGYMIAREILKHGSKDFKHVHAGYFKENKLVHLLKHQGAQCVQLSIDDEKTICDAYGKADVVVVVPPVSDKHWGKEDCCVYLHAAVKAEVKGLVLCSKINADKMREMKMLAPLYAMEEALHKIKDKIKCVSMLRCSLDIDLMWVFRQQVAKQHKLCLSVDKDAKFAPLVMEDGARGLYNMLTDEKFPAGIYELTGPEKLTFVDVAHKISSAVDKKIEYEHVSRKDMERYLHHQGEICENEICFIGDIFEAVSKKMLCEQTDDLKRLLDHEPMTVKKFLEKNSRDFKPRSDSDDADASD
ncbi:hypothetical protein GGH94_004671 [Coemansia aciculifera]|uniref:NmrA-like domain-containing protein n=1 Tax=Coemansia aciculifera TaxID=417176 RepID=A0A9W8ILG0_9FUNG|nr:hypothetical protein GGH94_004671 [Coemansia aciculifera]KAJ2871659.1 hypothetical protein GGH93_004641 [Coemansia aciculifera]